MNILPLELVNMIIMYNAKAADHILCMKVLLKKYDHYVYWRCGKGEGEFNLLTWFITRERCKKFPFDGRIKISMNALNEKIANDEKLYGRKLLYRQRIIW